jgi:hypothetical protein
VNVVGHDAVGVEDEVKPRYGGDEFFQQSAASCRFRKKRGTIFGADRDKVRAAADVIAGLKAQLFFVEGHGQKLARRGSFVEAVL